MYLFCHAKSFAYRYLCTQQFCTKMDNWVSLVRDAHRVVTIRDSDIPSLDGTSSSGVPVPEVPAGLKILHSLASSTSLTALRNIRFNLDTAALYLLKLLSEASFDLEVSQKESNNDKVADIVMKYRYYFLKIYLKRKLFTFSLTVMNLLKRRIKTAWSLLTLSITSNLLMTTESASAAALGI